MKRIPCPINPNHSIYERDLKRHVRICPDRRHDVSVLPYFEENCHALRGLAYLSERSRAAQCATPVVEATHDVQDGGDDGVPPAHVVPSTSNGAAAAASTRFTHRDLTPESLASLCKKVKSLYDLHIAPTIIKSHVPLVVSDGTLRVNMKHSTQHASLTKILVDRLDRTTPVGEGGQRVFLELGAGKGGLAFAIAGSLASSSPKVVPPASNDEVVPLWMVVDIGGFRRKRDGCVSETDHKFHRLRINIKDLALDKVPLLLSTSGDAHPPPALPAPQSSTHLRHQFVGLGKHLCGACTDFAISCITSRLPPNDSCDAILLATCCHHLCELRHLNSLTTTTPPPTNNESTSAVLSLFDTTFSEEEFAAIVSMTSWAVCGPHMVSAERQQVGYACKRVIDMMRVAHLRSVCKFDNVELHEYASEEVTGENVCIVAWRGRAL
ncbi:zinc finger protein, putative [Bodo saltans]|uniref:tRNA:m(4)X modification enzyme TRM13 n=1 Tax=Bodo saltans TaxID=75058 RepID=A0A0S4IU97_BODSA|nr:zinc finger protein, putative [Bodo saltans]|eukprot:CUF65463.1 zinc finger protein, putative [Bodo saltans]